jgi:DHA1 family putative efflux transporter-like MFS transporter
VTAIFYRMSNNIKIVLLATICFVLGTSEFVIVGVLDKIASSSDITIAQAGQLITVFAITVAVGTPIIMSFISRSNQKKTLIMALSLVVVSCVMMTVFSNYYLLLLSRMVMAMGVGVFNVLCFIVATKLAKPERRGRAVATITLGFNAALIIGLPIGRVITSMLGWKAIFVFTATLSFLSVFAILRFIPSFNGESPVPFRGQLNLLKKQTIILSLLTSLFWILGYSLLYTYITPYLQHTISINDNSLSTVFLVFGFATLAGNKTGGFLGDRIGVSKTIVASLAVNVITLITLSAFVGHSFFVIPLLVLWGLAAWTPGPLFRFSIIELAPTSPSVILSVYNSIIQFGMATGAALGGFEIEHIPTIMLSWTAAGLVLISLLFAILFSIKTQKKTKLELAKSYQKTQKQS